MTVNTDYTGALMTHTDMRRHQLCAILTGLDFEARSGNIATRHPALLRRPLTLPTHPLMSGPGNDSNDENADDGDLHVA